LLFWLDSYLEVVVRKAQSLAIKSDRENG
jgi:hypothetical protein